MPWSMALRTRWVSGSRMLSIRVRSSSVSAPSITSCTSRPQETATSRTVRGNLLNTCSIGCIRVLTAASCRELVTVLIRWITPSRTGSVDSMLRSSLRARTSSPTRSRIEASSPTSTLMDESAAGAAGFAGMVAGVGGVAGAAGAVVAVVARAAAGTLAAGVGATGAGSTGGGTTGTAGGGGRTGTAAAADWGAGSSSSCDATAASVWESSRKSCSPSTPVSSIA
jgi:hypothetical protein